MFGFAEKISRAFESNSGAMRTSVKTFEISAASSPFTIPLSATMPPKAEVGSEAKAFLYAAPRSPATAAPQGLACLTITAASPPPSERSARVVRAASTS